MRQVSIIGQQFPVPEDTDAPDMPKWATLYTDALKAAFAATPSSAFPVPTAADNDKVLITVGGLPKWTVSPYVKKSGDTMTGTLRLSPSGGGTVALEAWNSGLNVKDGVGAFTEVTHGSARLPVQSALLSQVGSSSSREFKTNIEPATDSSAFDAIQPVLFDYREDTQWANDPDKAARHVGFIAEDVEAAGLGVRKTDDGTVIGLRESELIAVLWLRVQELETRITALEAKS